MPEEAKVEIHGSVHDDPESNPSHRLLATALAVSVAAVISLILRLRNHGMVSTQTNGGWVELDLTTNLDIYEPQIDK